MGFNSGLEDFNRCLINPLNAELNPIYHLLALLGAYHILHVSRIRVKLRHSLYTFLGTERQEPAMLSLSRRASFQQ
jgi:hypothetical protein